MQIRRYTNHVTSIWLGVLAAVTVIGWCAPILAAEAKTSTNLLTQEEITSIRQTKTWLGLSTSSIMDTANRWMKYSPQQLRDKVPPASVPRAFDVHFDQDPQHPEAIKAIGKYPWIIDPDVPYKVKCPVGGELYPTNDFDPKHVGKPSEVSSVPYVDNGWGWKSPNNPQKYWFVAYYAHWMYHGYLEPGALALAQAYVITGDKKYSRQAAALLDRIAEEYPQMDYVKQSRFGTEIQPGNYHGRIVNSIWETGLVQNLAMAYDYIYPALEGDSTLEQAVGKNATQIKKNIEQNLLQSAARSIYTMDGRIRGNFGMHHSALATVAIVLDNQDTEKYLDFVLNATGLGTFSYEGIVTGLANLVFRDGAPNESSPGYNSLWTGQFEEVARLMLRRSINLYKQEPKLKGLFDYPLRLVMAEKFSPNIGDTGGVTSSGIVGYSQGTYTTAYQQYGENAYASGKAITNKSDNMSAYGLAMLRTGKGSDAAGVALYYGPGGGHDHFDRLNLELFAKGQRISPDLGYPDYASDYDKKRYGFVAHTVSHNTVLVDQRRQANKNGGRIQLFSASPTVQYVDVRAEEAYPGRVETYRRSVALIDASESDSYVVDIFRVSGGKQHDYSIHGPDGTFSTQGLTLSPPQTKGTLAGENVPFSYLYDATQYEMPGYTGGYGGYVGSGFSYFRNVQSSKPTGVWDADWAMSGQTHLRTTFVPQPGTEVYVADGEPPLNVPSNPRSLKYVLARTKSNDSSQLNSAFVTVMQPYVGTPFIKSTAQIVGSNKANDTIALQIAHSQGIDYVFQATQNQLFTSLDETTRFQGAVGVLSRTSGGILRHANLVGGQLLQQGDIRIDAAASYLGHVVNVDYANAKVTVSLAPGTSELPLGDILAKQRIVFSNDKHATEYVVAQVKAIGERTYEISLEEKELRTAKAAVNFAGSSNISSKTPLPLDQYYNGQYLVNPANGQGSRIKSISGSGTSIALTDGNLGLKTGNVFNIYDFGKDDQFMIASSVHIQGDKSGIYTVNSNVSGQVTMWDGSVHAFNPGSSTFAMSLLGVKVTQPSVGSKVAGQLNPSVQVDTPVGLSMTNFSLHMGEIPLYTDTRVPAKGELAIDTTLFPDGNYTLTATATDQRGKAVSQSVPITIENYWTMTTDLDAPIMSGWFGNVDFTHIYDKSAGWDFVKEAPADFADDYNRMVRTSGQTEYIEWEAPQLQRFDIVVFTKSGQNPQAIELSTSADERGWQKISYRAEAGATTTAGWQRWRLLGQVSAPDSAAKFFRITVPGAIPANDLQLGRVELVGRTDPALVGSQQ